MISSNQDHCFKNMQIEQQDRMLWEQCGEDTAFVLLLKMISMDVYMRNIIHNVCALRSNAPMVSLLGMVKLLIKDHLISDQPADS